MYVIVLCVIVLCMLDVLIWMCVCASMYVCMYSPTSFLHISPSSPSVPGRTRRGQPTPPARRYPTPRHLTLCHIGLYDKVAECLRVIGHLDLYSSPFSLISSIEFTFSCSCDSINCCCYPTQCVCSVYAYLVLIKIPFWLTC